MNSSKSPRYGIDIQPKLPPRSITWAKQLCIKKKWVTERCYILVNCRGVHKSLPHSKKWYERRWRSFGWEPKNYFLEVVYFARTKELKSACQRLKWLLTTTLMPRTDDCLGWNLSHIVWSFEVSLKVVCVKGGRLRPFRVSLSLMNHEIWCT